MLRRGLWFAGGGRAEKSGLGAVGAVDLDEFVVDAEEEEGCGPLADEEGGMLLPRGLKDYGNGHGGEGKAEINTGWNLCGAFFDGGGDLIFLSFTFGYAVVGHIEISRAGFRPCVERCGKDEEGRKDRGSFLHGQNWMGRIEPRCRGMGGRVTTSGQGLSARGFICVIFVDPVEAAFVTGPGFRATWQGQRQKVERG